MTGMASVAYVGSAYAQSVEGSVFGSGKPGARVTMTNVETGATRSGAVDASGAFTMSKVQPGTYKITSEGVTQEITVSIGSGTQVVLGAQPERIQVIGGRGRSGIDVSSTETNSVFSQAQIQALPVPRTVNAVALLAPGTVKGDRNFTDGSTGEAASYLPSFGGASVAENGYYINGFDVTSIRNFLSYANVPFEAIGEQQIKSGGYSAEYGRSLGGVVSLATKRGTNVWKGGVSVYWEPESLQSKGKNVRDLEPTRPNNYTYFKRDEKNNNLTYNVYAGGPLIENKLFVFGLVEGKDDKNTVLGNSTATVERSVKPNGILKLDFRPHENHLLELTAISDKKKVKIEDYTNATPYSTSLDGAAANSTRESGGDVKIFKYTGNMTEALTVSALVGKVNNQRPKTSGARTLGQDCPVVLNETTQEVGCWAKPFPGLPVRDPNAPDDKDTRDAWRLDVDYVLGDHTLRAGLDNQKFKSWEAGGSTYSGGVYYRYFVSSNGAVNGVTGALAPGGTYVRGRVLQSTTGIYSVENKAYYIEDNWRIRKDIMLYAGLRSESFDNKNGDGVSFVKADNKLAPRIGAAWDANGDSTLKIFGNAGRYYIPVASNTNIRSTRGELFATSYYSWGGVKDPRTQGPVGALTRIGPVVVSGDGSLPDPGSIADTGLKPMSQDEYILGFQKAVAKGWTFGTKYTHRSINNGMDDWCDSAISLRSWANANGYPNYDPGYMCMIVNPGNDVRIKIDPEGDGKLVNVVVPSTATGLAKYSRKYDALELSIEKAWDGKWGMNASYTYSKSKGTAEGYVNSIINQSDAGVTQEFDYGSMTHGANGYLPNDRRHQFKIFGNYSVLPEFRVGANFTLSSGRPISCVGFVPPTVADYGPTNGSGAYGSASSFYCLNSQGNTVLTTRGSQGRTPWTNQLDLQFAYMPQLSSKTKLTLQADIFNVLNSQHATEVDEIRDFSRATSITPPGQLNMNYGQPTSYQTPRYVRLTGRWEF